MWPSAEGAGGVAVGGGRSGGDEEEIRRRDISVSSASEANTWHVQ